MLLQGAQVRRVGRADIYRDVIGDLIHRFKAGKVIRNRIGDRHAARLADVHAEDAVGPVPAQILCDSFSADVIESEVIYQRAILRKTKQAWLWISRLRLTCDGADFDESKTQRCQFANVTSVLIKTGS